MHYSIAILSGIPVYETAQGLMTDHLWARDLGAQVETTPAVTLICPVKSQSIPEDATLSPLPGGIRLIPDATIMSLETAKTAITGCDVVQVPGNKPIWKAMKARRLLEAANRMGAVTITGVSSNRPKTLLLNAVSPPFRPLRILKASMEAAGIIAGQLMLSSAADGLMLVGRGLGSLLVARRDDVHFAAASWIRDDDIITPEAFEAKMAARSESEPLKLCIATRLERMKGVHIAIDALAILLDRIGAQAAELTILGEGPEMSALEQQADRLGLEDRVCFSGVRSYPNAFLDEIRRQDVMLLTNLNDEQPRLIFDAGSQGLAVICPDTETYEAIGAPAPQRFARGDAKSLALVIENHIDRHVYESSARASRALAETCTIEHMHKSRSSWISDLILKKRSKHKSAPPGFPEDPEQSTL